MIRTSLLALIGFTILLAIPAAAQRTGDHIVPSIETVCDGDPYNFGLCNAYCEALDCESPTPLGTPRACSNLLKNYMKKSDGLPPPCACPCEFDLEGDIETMADFVFGEYGVDIDVAATAMFDCPVANPDDGEDSFLFQATNVPEGLDSTYGGQIFYWVTQNVGSEGGTCEKYGEGIDDFQLDNNVFLNETIEVLTTNAEVGACRNLLNYFCSLG